MADTITWGGTVSNTLGIVVERPKALGRPRRKMKTYDIPGGNSFVEMEDAWEDYTQTYEIWAGDDSYGDAADFFADITTWLFKDGFNELEDSEEPLVYREAYFAGPLDVANLWTMYGRAKINFICHPQRYLKTGKTAITKSSSGTSITNPTAYASRPTVKVTGSGTGTFTIGGTTVSLSGIQSGMIVDSKTMTVTDGLGANLNSKMALGNFPSIPSGTSTVSFTGGITKLEITPHWYYI